MTTIVGFSLRRKSDNQEIYKWKTLPGRLDLPNGDVAFDVNTAWQHPLYSIVAATWDSDPAEDAEATRRAAILADTGRLDLLNRLQTATSAEIDTWFDNNVTTLASARNVLKAIVKLIAFDSRPQ